MCKMGEIAQRRVGQDVHCNARTALNRPRVAVWFMFAAHSRQIEFAAIDLSRDRRL
jgi:hypothetical protein